MSSQVFAKAEAMAKATVVATEKVFAEATMSTMILGLLRGTGPTVKQIAEMAYDKMDSAAAFERIHNKLPQEVVALVRKHKSKVSTSNVADAPGDHSEESLAKALKILNDMIFKAWLDLDDTVISCKEFEERNRGTFDQVMTDLQRLGEQVSDLERQRIEANEGMQTATSEFNQISEGLKIEQSNYKKTRDENSQILELRQNDLAVMNYIMQLTRCPDGPGTALLAMEDGVPSPSKAVHVCEGENRRLELHFDDSAMEAEVERRMTPAAQSAIHEMLQRVDAKPLATVFTQEETDPITATTTTTYGMPTPPMRRTPVQKQRDLQKGGQWKKCRDEKTDCGQLHDSMSLMWGKFKDRVDELQFEMDKNQADFQRSQSNLDQTGEAVRNAKARFMMMIAEVISNLNGDQSESASKEQQRQSLDKDYSTKMAICKAAIEELMFTNICATRRVRNQVMMDSTVVVVSQIQDCDVTDWKPNDCSKECDDRCPMKDPYACGGWQELTRDIVEQNTPTGVQCPPLVRKKKCNQIKCPVDCELSMYSGYSKCTKECESGVQTRTRAIITKPRNGGAACDTVQESRPCNTGSCDRNCKLSEWTKFSGCSMACGGGVQDRKRKVVVPMRGEGECPKTDSPERLDEQGCNQMPCVGDEVCIAQQDLILAIDGSGSLRVEGFKAIQKFAATLVTRYEGQYFGQEAMRVGVVLFGNGHVLADGTVSPAILVHELSSDMASVKASIEALQWQRGFTNMAQAFSTCERMWQLKGRKDAVSAVALITDGKPSFFFQTHEKVMQLKDKHIKILFAPVMRFEGKELALMKKWASQPWQTHLVHIPGIVPLEADPMLFAGLLVATFCPNSMSPSAEKVSEEEVGYFLLRENGRCGVRGQLLGDEVDSIGDCAVLARKAGVEAFSYGSWVSKGKCYAENMDVSKTKLTQWQIDRRAPLCHETGGWKEDRLFDTYVLE